VEIAYINLEMRLIQRANANPIDLLPHLLCAQSH
jgi:hypothetical protein